MHVKAVSRENCMVKKQKDLKGIKFGDRQNSIHLAISVGVDNSSQDN